MITLDLHKWNNSAKYHEKQSIINVQAAPKTQPGGVQGALFKLRYQSLVAPSPIK